MISREEFIDMINDELGLNLSLTDLEKNVDNLSDWDSVYLLRLLRVLETKLGRKLSASQLLDIHTIGAIYDLVTEHV